MDGRCLHVHLLGGFLLVDEDTPVTTLHAPRLQALLAYLILKRSTPQSRQHIAFSLWPESTEAQSQTNLRNLLHQLHRMLPHADDYISLNGRTIQWRSDAPDTIDIAEFEQAVTRAEQSLQHRDRVAAQASLKEAVALYRGELLPDCYDEWILPERERLRQLFTMALARLVALMEEQRDYEAAITYAQRLLKAEPLHEAAYLQLMRLQALSGNRAAALHTYQTCADLLQRELGTEPGQPLRIAYAQLRAPRSVARISASQAGLVGRGQEWIQLLHCWQGATAGPPQFVVLLGDAGIGKTRLAEELLHWAEQQGISVAHAHCYPGEGDLIYAPVIGLLRSPNIHTVLPTLSLVWLAELSRLLPELRVEQPNIPLAGPLTEPWQRQHLFEALRQAVLAARPPLLLCIDDLHWCDGASLEWLRYLLHDDAPAQVMVLATLRPEEVSTDHPLVDLLNNLGARGQATMIELAPLDITETTELATQVAGHVLSAEAGAALYNETEGNPLFIVETIQAGCDIQRVRVAGAAAEMYVPRDPVVPTRIQAIVTSRLAKLSSPARELADVAATIGRSFPFTLLARAFGKVDEETLVHSLEELRQHRIIREHVPGTYDFSHNKLREVTYAQLSLTRRRMLHRRVAEALGELHGRQRSCNSARQAAHYEQAGCMKQAIHAYQHAAEAAQRMYAPVEAAGYYRRAITLLTTGLDDKPVVDHSDEREARLQAGLGDVLALAERHEEARQAYERALVLVEAEEILTQAGLHRSIGNTWRAQTRFDLADREYQVAIQVLDQKGHENNDSTYWREWLESQLDRLECALWLGPPPAGISAQWADVQETLDRYGTPHQRARSMRCMLSASCWQRRSLIDHDLVAQAEQMLQSNEATGDPILIAQARWLAGAIRLFHNDLKQAEAYLQAALALAERTGNVRMQAYCLGTLGLLCRKRRDVDHCRQHAYRNLAIAATYQFHDSLGMAHADLAWVAWCEEKLEQVIEHGREAIDHWQQSPIVYPFHWTARWPLIAAALARHQVATAIEDARMLLHPLQQQLPEPLETTMTQAIAAFEQDRLNDAGGHMQRTLELARQLGFL